MRSLVALSFAATASAVSFYQAVDSQFPLFDIGAAASSVPQTPISVKKLEPKLQKDAVREKLIWGPFSVKAANESHEVKGIQFKLDPNSDLIQVAATLCRDCIVIWAQGDLSGDKDGSKLDLSSGVYNHHILSTDYGRRMVPPPIVSRCANGKMGGFNFDLVGMKGKGGASAMGGMSGMGHSHPAPAQKRQLGDLGKLLGSVLGGTAPKPEELRGLMDKFMPAFSVFFGQGDENSPTSWHGMNKFNAGFALGANDKINIMAELINYNKFRKDIYLTLEYEYVPNMKEHKDWYDVGMGAINVSPCGGMNLRPPADKAEKYTSPPWTVEGSGYLLDVKPHLHDGGINTTFYVNGVAKCTSSAIYGGDGGLSIDGQKWETITAYTPCPEPVKITKGDNLTMEAYYDLTQHRLRPQSNDHSESAEGMALALFQYAKPPPQLQ